jgi:DNA polymerase
MSTGSNLYIDFETVFDSEYSLTKMSMAEYLRDARFETLSVAYAVDKGPVRFHSGNMKLLREVLARLPWDDLTVVSHNAMFDGAILEWKLGFKPKHYLCTMMGSNPGAKPYTGSVSLKNLALFLEMTSSGSGEVLPRKGELPKPEAGLAALSEYNTNDVILCRALAERVVLPQLPESERLLLDLTIKKFIRPRLLLDKSMAQTALVDGLLRRSSLLSALPDGYTEKTIMSNIQLANALRNYGVEPPVKMSTTTGGITYAMAQTDDEFVALTQHPHPGVQALVRARLECKSTLEHTRLESFIKQADYQFPVPLNYWGAHTGRWSGYDGVNLQNLPRKSVLRSAIIAPPDHILISVDLSQIEARMLACIAGQNDLVQQFAEGRDVYCEFASALYGREITPADERERFLGKTGILSLGYQGGVNAVNTSLVKSGSPVLPKDEAQRMVNAYRATYPHIRRFWGACETVLSTMTRMSNDALPVRLPALFPAFLTLEKYRIKLPSGMYLTYPELSLDRASPGRYVYRSGKQLVQLYGGKLCENLVQALARIVLSDAELRLHWLGLDAVMSVHDELVYCVHIQEAKSAFTLIRDEVTKSPEWLPNLPVACKIKAGKNYQDTK